MELELILKACVNMYFLVMKISIQKVITFLSFEERQETKISGSNQRIKTNWIGHNYVSQRKVKAMISNINHTYVKEFKTDKEELKTGHECLQQTKQMEKKKKKQQWVFRNLNALLRMLKLKS